MAGFSRIESRALPNGCVFSKAGRWYLPLRALKLAA
jgi:hypothetical protein